MKRIQRSLMALASALIIGAASPAIAAEAAEGVLNAISQEALPAGQVIQVRALDDSTDNLALKRQFEDALRRSGYQVSDQGTLVFTFEVENEIGAWTSGQDRYFVELYARGSRRGGEDAAAKFNVFDSERGGILNKGKGGTNIVTPSKYRINVTLDSIPDGGRITRFWHAWARGDLSNYDSRDLTQAMVDPLVRGIGKTIRRETFPLP